MFFFFNDTATTEIYTLSLHDALPIYRLVEILHLDAVDASADLAHLACFELARAVCLMPVPVLVGIGHEVDRGLLDEVAHRSLDRKSTRLNSSHANISYAVFCLKKKNELV